MPSEARIVYGGTYEWGTDGTNYDPIPEVTGLAVPVVSKDFIDVTNSDSPGGFREFIPGLKDPGEVSMPANYTSDFYEQALQYDNDDTVVYFRTTLNPSPTQATGDVITFTAYPTPVLQTNAIGEIIGMELQLRITGQPGFTKGPAA